MDIFGTLSQIPLQQLRDEFGTRIHLNMFPFSNIARPTTGIQRTSIWGFTYAIVIVLSQINYHSNETFDIFCLLYEHVLFYKDLMLSSFFFCLRFKNLYILEINKSKH